jgi:hypothetical protein
MVDVFTQSGPTADFTRSMERLAVHPFGNGSELPATGLTRQGTRFLEVVGVGVSSGSARPATGASPSFRNMRQPTLDQADAEGLRGAG